MQDSRACLGRVRAHPQTPADFDHRAGRPVASRRLRCAGDREAASVVEFDLGYASSFRQDGAGAVAPFDRVRAGREVRDRFAYGKRGTPAEPHAKLPEIQPPGPEIVTPPAGPGPTNASEAVDSPGSNVRPCSSASRRSPPRPTFRPHCRRRGPACPRAAPLSPRPCRF